MQKIIMKGQQGFTLIELVIVLVLLSVLVSVAIPKYASLTSSAQTAAERGTSDAVKSAFAIYLASNSGAFPSSSTLVGNLSTSTSASKPGCSATASGVLCMLGDGATTFTIPLYQDSACQTTITTTAQNVQCVGQYP